MTHKKIPKTASYLSVLAVCCAALLGGQIVLQAQLTFFVESDPTKVVHLLPNADNILFCRGTGTFPLFADRKLQNDAGAHFWIYQYTGTEPPYDGSYYISKYIINSAEQLLANSTLTEFSYGGVYFVKTKQAMDFRCGEGLMNPQSSNIFSTTGTYSFNKASSAFSQRSSYGQRSSQFALANDDDTTSASDEETDNVTTSCPQLSCRVPNITSGCTYIPDPADSNGCRGGCGHIECDGYAQTTGNMNQQSSNNMEPIFSSRASSVRSSFASSRPSSISNSSVSSSSQSSSASSRSTASSSSRSTAGTAASSSTSSSSSAANSIGTQATADLAIKQQSEYCGGTSTKQDCSKALVIYDIESKGPDSATAAYIQFSLAPTAYITSIQMNGNEMTCTPSLTSKAGLIATYKCVIGTIPSGGSASINVYFNFRGIVRCEPLSLLTHVNSAVSDSNMDNNTSNSITLPCDDTASSSTSSSQSSVCSNGSVAFNEMPTLASLISHADQVITVDANNDGVDDLMTRTNGTIALYINQGDGTFAQLYDQVHGSATLGNMALGDIDRDGTPELLSITGELGGDTIVFTLDSTDIATGETMRMRTSDQWGNWEPLTFSSVRFGVDANGDVLAFVGNGGIGELSRLSIMGNNAALTKVTTDRNVRTVSNKPWKGKMILDADLEPDVFKRLAIDALTVEDIDSDGTDDLLVQRNEGRDVRLQWISGADNVTHDLGLVFGGASMSGGAGKKVWVTASDINQDRLTDLVITSNNPSAEPDSRIGGQAGSMTYWMQNKGRGTQWNIYNINRTGNRYGIASGDWNDDGLPDIVTAGRPAAFFRQSKDCSGTVQPIYSF